MSTHAHIPHSSKKRGGKGPHLHPQSSGGPVTVNSLITPETPKEVVDSSLVNIMKMVEEMQAAKASVLVVFGPEQEKRLLRLKEMIRNAKRRKGKLEVHEEHIQEVEDEIEMSKNRIQVAKAMEIPIQ